MTKLRPLLLLGFLLSNQLPMIQAETISPPVSQYVIEPLQNIEPELALAEELIEVENIINDPIIDLGNIVPEIVNDGSVYNGWINDLNGKWIPGMPSFESQFLVAPDIFTGSAWPYGPNVMEATAEYNGLSLDNAVDGVALMTCADHGGLVWLKRPDHNWEGPFKVVDCAQRNHLYNVAVHNSEAVEVGFKTAEKWGMVKNIKQPNGEWRADWIQRSVNDVMVSKIPPEDLPENYEIVNYQEWFKQRVKFDWVQIGSGWASGYYEHCLGCASTHFRKAHNHCVPLCVKDYCWANKIACYLRKDCKDNELLVAQCEYCVGNVAQSGRALTC